MIFPDPGDGLDERKHIVSNRITGESIATGLRDLADLVDAGLFTERAFPMVRESVMVPLASLSAVARFAAVLGVKASIDGAAGDVHVRATAILDGIEVSGYCIMPLAEHEMTS